jgi:glycosyltransferase involved in cell wall biosynthesis
MLPDSGVSSGLAPIFLLDDQPPFSGIGVFARKIYDGLRPAFPTLRWWDLSYRDHGQPNPPGRERPPGLVASAGVLGAPRARRRNHRALVAAKYLRGQRVHVCGAGYSVGNEAARRIVTVHDYYYRGIDRRSLRHPELLLRDLYQDRLNLRLRREIASADAVVVPSRHVQSVLARRLGIESTVIPQWVDPAVFRPRSRSEARRTLGLPPDGRLVLSVGAPTWNKNLATMERVVRRLDPGTAFVKVGAPLYRVGRRIVQRDRVPPDLYPLYFNAADAYLHTSREEGFGLPLLEALASGTPVVAPPGSGAGEILGEVGYYVRSPLDIDGYVAQLREALARGISDSFERASLRQAARFAPERGLAAYSTIYRRVFG